MPKNETPETQESQESTETPVITDDVRDYVQKVVNAAVTTHMSKAVPKLIAGAIEKSTAPILERLQALQPPPADAGSEKAESAEAKALKAKFDDLNAKYEEERRARETEQQKRLRDEERASAASVMREAGLSEAKIKAALAVLHTEEKRIARDESGSIVFRMQRKGYEEPVSLADGIKEWLKTEEGKEYVPPRAAAGSGAKGGGAPTGSGKNGTDARAVLGSALTTMLTGVNPDE